jgi:DNA mismatch repair protein MutL
VPLLGDKFAGLRGFRDGEPPWVLRGYLSPPELSFRDRNHLYLFVNGRAVRDRLLLAALADGWEGFFPKGAYPAAVLFLDLPPEAVDVNVHPTKAEVRFRERERVFSAVQRAVRRALLAYTPVPGIQPPLAWKPASAWEAPPRRSDPGWEMAGEAGGADLQGAAPPAEAAPPVGGPPAPLVGGVPLLRPVGQIALAYLIAEGPDGLYLIDQHAAHERVLFERMTGQAGESAASQSLLEPVSVELPPAASRLLESQLASLDRLGFRVEEFGRNTFLVRAVPALLTGMDPAAALRVLVEDFEEDESPLQGQAEARIIARVCKRAAVKAGQTLSAEEQKALLADLEACRSPRTCPHGRPTMIHLSVDLLERQFGRRGPR